LGGGAYANVYMVERLKDKGQFAMKIIEYRKKKFTEKEKANMISEIGLLKLHKSDNICSCVEAFDYKNCAFIIIELMAANITKILERTDLIYSENIAKFICH
jgi:serine/threonine protein kinase